MRFFLFIIMSLFYGCSKENDENYLNEIRDFQEELNHSFYDMNETPLRGELYENFKEHPFFSIQKKYRIESDYERITDSETFEMMTSSGESKTFLPYAKAKFQLDGKSHELILYQSQSLIEFPEYEDYLFLPFKDATNGYETYAGGRYLDLKIPEGSKIIIDFNKAYQPYCAYNLEDYSCPIVPKENHLNIRIPAGVTYHKDDFKF